MIEEAFRVEWDDAHRLVSDLESAYGERATIILARVLLDTQDELEKALSERSQGYVRARPDD